MKVHIIVTLLSSISGLYAFSWYPFKHDSYGYRFGSQNNITSHRLVTRADSATTCDNSLTSKVFTRFTGIFFGDFTTRNGQDILGPLAVRGTLSGDVYTINANGAVNCSDIENSFDGYGLVVGGSLNATSHRVRGAIFLPFGTDTSKIQSLNSDCPIVTNRGTGLFDFERAYVNAVFSSQLFAALPPTIKLDENDNLVRLAPKIGDFDVMTVNSCNNFNCNLYPGQLSYSSHMFNGVGNWNGAKGLTFPDNLVINIPVSVNTTFTLSGNQPSLGISVCNTIYNFYPSDANGVYTPGRIYISRNTGGQLGGFTLAPEANIEDSGTGNFAGLLVANDYVWKQGTGGVEIHDYAAIGGKCSGFTGCFPIFNNIDPEYPVLIEEPPETSSTITNDQTTSSTVTYSTITEDPSGTVTYSTITEDPSDTVTYSTITENPSDTMTYSTITENPSDTMTYSTITENPSDTMTYSTITENPSDTMTYSTITENPSDTMTYSTITEDPSDSMTYSTIIKNPSDTMTYSTITENPSDTMTYSTITENPSDTNMHSTITESPSATITYSTITEIPSDTVTDSTIIDVHSDDTITHSTISGETSNTITHSTVTYVPTTTATHYSVTTITSSSVVITLTFNPDISSRIIPSQTDSSSDTSKQPTSVNVPTSLIESTVETTTQYYMPYTDEDYYINYNWHDKHKKSKYYKSGKHKGHKHSDDEECDEEEDDYGDY